MFFIINLQHYHFGYCLYNMYNKLQKFNIEI